MTPKYIIDQSAQVLIKIEPNEIPKFIPLILIGTSIGNWVECPKEVLEYCKKYE
jgi:hypothetical protein